MKKRNNRIFTAVIAIAFVFSALTGCSAKNMSQNNTIQTETVNPSNELQQAKSKLLAEWYELLEANEAIYSGMFRMLQYSESYGQNNTWDSLLKARASASAVLVAVRQVNLPTLDLTENQITLLAESGVEINAVQREFEALESWLDSKNNTAALFCYTLEDDVFMSASVEDAIPSMTTFYQDYFTKEYQYLSHFTNYLLLQMDSGNIWQLWMEQLPCMADCADIWYETQKDIERADGELLSEMEALQSQMGSSLGISEYTLEIVQEAVDTGDMDALQRELNWISGVPGYFPIPTWLPDTTNLYLITDSHTKEKRLVKSGEELDEAPSACYISCGAISLEEVESYDEQLKMWGVETYGTWNESKDSWQLLAISGSSTMMIEWTEDETLLYLTEQVGCLIPELYLYAMTME